MVCSFRKDKYVAKKFNGIYRGRSFPVSDFPGGIKVDKNEVIQITLNLIKEKKHEGASVGEIIKIMNTSAGSLYYYFKSKNEIYEKITEYIFVEIDEVLKEVKVKRNKRKYLSELTETLIRFLEENDKMLFFLVNIRGSKYMDFKPDPLEYLSVFKKALLKKESSVEDEKQIVLKLRMFTGAIYEVLYSGRFTEERKLEAEEIKEICNIFWNEI